MFPENEGGQPSAPLFQYNGLWLMGLKPISEQNTCQLQRPLIALATFAVETILRINCHFDTLFLLHYFFSYLLLCAYVFLGI